MNPILPEECVFPELLLKIPAHPGKRGRLQKEERRSLIATIRSYDTTRYAIERKIILGMILNETPTPPEMSRNIRWPHEGTIYVEYTDSIKLDPRYPGDELSEYFNGLLIIPNGDTAEIQTLGTSGLDILLRKDTIDLRNGTIDSDRWDEIPEDVREMERQGTQRYFARLAAYMNAFVARDDKNSG